MMNIKKNLAVSLPAKASDFHFPLFSHDSTDSIKPGTKIFSPKYSLFLLTFIVHSSLIASHYLSRRGSNIYQIDCIRNASTCKFISPASYTGNLGLFFTVYHCNSDSLVLSLCLDY